MNKFKNAVNPIKKGLGAFFVTKKAKISFLIVVWSIVAIQMYVNYRQASDNTSQAVTAFSVVEDSIMEETVKGYGYFGKMEITENTRKKMLENLAYKLGITDGYTFTNGNGDGFEKIVLTKEGKHAVTTLQVISMETESDEPEQYIVMEIQIKEKAEQAVSLYQKVKRIYEEIGIDGQVSLEIAAEQQGNCISENSSVIEKVFDMLDAKKIDTIKENGIFTVYGYTKAEDSYLTLNGKKVNIQIVMTYDEKEDKTYIKIGVPLVNSSY
ncbi:MAG: YwmB family TATA-box binding protein [Lachnospiraceae bacterium]